MAMAMAPKIDHFFATFVAALSLGDSSQLSFSFNLLLYSIL